jgi:hypothetical protein
MMSTNRHEPLVAPRYEREPDSVPGAFYVVLDQCITCELPPKVAPATVTWDEEFQDGGCDGCPNHCRVSKQPETDEELELMIDAAWGSCVEAIRYCGTDEYTLNRFKELDVEGICDALPEPEEPEPSASSHRLKPWWRFW